MKRFSIGFTIFTFLFIAGLVYSIAQPKPSGWTIETLKEYFEGKLDAIQLAVTKAEQATEKRFEGVNEFRASLADQNRTFMPRSEAESMINDLSNRINANNEAIKKIENMKQGGNIVWAYILGGGGFVFGIISLMFNYQKGIK